MACCAFIAFLIGQCLAVFQSWRSRIARLLGLKSGGPAKSGTLAPRWRRGLLAALVIEIGLATGGAIGAGLVQGDGAWSALCSATTALAAH